MRFPVPRGPLSSAVIDALQGKPTTTEVDVSEPLRDDDFHLALYLCYELHYSGFDDAERDLEWDPELLELRGELERCFEDALRAYVPHGEGSGYDVVDKVLEAIASDDGPSVSSFIAREATTEQVREFLIHRSAYQLKEADPHSWLIPRIRSGAKAALVEIQSDEYGGGRPEWVHSALFARSMEALGLDPTYGAYIDRIPGVTLATVNLVSMFGLHRRLRGAGVGHLATFESTSSEPNGRYAAGLRRLGFEGDGLRFFDEHVEADAVHETIAIHDLIGRLVRDEPALAPDIVWGARCLMALDRLWGEHLMTAWADDRSSLLPEPLSART